MTDPLEVARVKLDRNPTELNYFTYLHTLQEQYGPNWQAHWASKHQWQDLDQRYIVSLEVT